MFLIISFAAVQYDACDDDPFDVEMERKQAVKEKGTLLSDLLEIYLPNNLYGHA